MNISNPLKKILPSRLGSQLILGIALIIVTSISLFVVDLISRQKVFFLKLNHDRGVSLSENLANISTSHLVALELDGLQNLVTTYKKMPGLEYAMVTSSDGIVLSHTNEKYLGLKANDSISAKLKPINATQVLLENNSILDVATPIINHNEIVGWARIGLSQTFLTGSLSEIRKSGILYILISLVVGSLFAIIVAGRLTKGLQALIIAAKKIKDGDRDLRVAPSKSIEVTQLGTVFNQMLDDISSNEKLLGMVLENMPVGVWILDEKGNIISTNPAGEELWKGVKYVGIEEYNLYKGWFTETGKEVQSHEWGAYIAIAENKPVFNQEIEIECFDKTRKTILNSAIPLHDTNGKIVGGITINVDITERKYAEKKIREGNYDIGERIKELRCLYKMSQLSNDPGKTIQDIVKDCANIIPPSYQFPEITCARVEFEGQMFESTDFIETIWKQEQDIISRGITLGKVQVYYKEEKPEAAEGPFLAEERLLINSIADILGSSAERKKSEENLKQSEEKNRALVENISDGIVLLNANSEIVYQSSSVERINGYSFESRKNKSAEALIYQQDKPAFTSFLEKVYNSPGIPFQSQFRMVHDDGHIMWVEGSMINMLHNDSIKGVIVNYRDVTAQKKVTELFKHQFENSPDIILIVGKDLKIESINKSRPGGPSVTELIGRNSIDVLPEESKQSAIEAILKCFETGQNQEIENALHSNRWVSSRFVPITIDGFVNHVMIIATDITERKKLEEHQRLFASIVNSSDDGIVSTSIDGEVTSWNHGAEKILGYSEKEMIGNHITLIIPTERFSDQEEITDKVKMGQSVDHFETQRKRKNGELIYVSLTVSPIMNASGKAIGSSCILRDVSQQKSMEFEREKIINEMVQRNRDLEQFSFIVSHNMRSPLSTLLGLTDMMEYDLNEDEGVAVIKGIKQSAIKLDTVIRDVNDILNVKKELLQSKVNINLNDLVKSISGDIQGMINKSSAKIDVDFSSLDNVDSISPYLYSIFLNLISNSIKYAKSDITPEIKIWTEKTENMACIYFKDNGIGIDLKKNKDHIFGLYKRFNLQIEGKGMGLFMVKTQVAALNGTIEIESKLGEGTLFVIKFPI